MPRKKKVQLALPAKAKEDIKTLSGIMSRWSVQLEDLGKEVFAWAKKHKFLILLGVGVVAFYRYWLMEPEEQEEEEEEY